MIYKIILISLLFALASAPYQLINGKNGAYIKNNTNRYVHCWLGQYEFNIKPNSRSRNYPYSKKWGCI